MRLARRARRTHPDSVASTASVPTVAHRLQRRVELGERGADVGLRDRGTRIRERLLRRPDGRRDRGDPEQRGEEGDGYERIAFAWRLLRAATITHPEPFLRGGENSFARARRSTPDGQERQRIQEQAHRRGDRHGHGLRRDRRRGGVVAARRCRRRTTRRSTRPSPTSRRTGPATMPDVYGQQYEPIPADRVFPYSREQPAAELRRRRPDPGALRRGRRQRLLLQQRRLRRLRRAGAAAQAARALRRLRGRPRVRPRAGATRSRPASATSRTATVYMEQQADCFAGCVGAARRQQRRRRTCTSRRTTSTPRSPVCSPCSDPSGIDGGQDGAHGNGFDRVSAFQDGYEGGAQTCADYENNPPDGDRGRLHELRGLGERRQPPADELLPTVTD